ncbi:MAG: Nif11-like leader peptide family natural product precursor [Coleofasciculus sp. G3-WIS-01]|uniref:Nif11-like leader peptide family natural product precursor n=1 Tax=Coleofasciculus sp. G3-WIS-01 TaxID=3069528 RepID=UPI0032F8CA87
MSDLNIQSFQAEDVSAEELQLQKAQQVIDELFRAAESDEKLKKQLEAAISPEKLVEIAASQGYELTVADLEILHDYDQEAAQLNSDELDDDELSEQELELVAGGCGRSPRGSSPRPRPARTKNSNYKKRSKS